MRESVVYQEILQEGRQEGRQEGLQAGRQEGLQAGLQAGRQEGRQEGEVAIVLRQLNRRLGAIDPQLQAQIQALTISQLEALSEVLLDFTEPSELIEWLQVNLA